MNNDPSHELPDHEDLPEEARDEIAPEAEVRAEAQPEAEVPMSPAEAALDALPKRELIDRHLRLMADQRRMRQRFELDLSEARRDATERTLLQWLDVLDAVERGLEASQDGDENDPWRQGMEGIRRQMLDVLARFGVTPFSPEGQPFDATEMEALCTAPAPGKEDDTVAQVERKGYRTKEGVLRPARVVVVRNA